MKASGIPDASLEYTPALAAATPVAGVLPFVNGRGTPAAPGTHGGGSLDNTEVDTWGYAYKDNVSPDTATFNWIELEDLSGDDIHQRLATVSGGDDDNVATISNYYLGFTFPFYGETYRFHWPLQQWPPLFPAKPDLDLQLRHEPSSA